MVKCEESEKKKKRVKSAGVKVLVKGERDSRSEVKSKGVSER
jgi:hypothetical protein